jgi:hypothetical protein
VGKIMHNVGVALVSVEYSDRGTGFVGCLGKVEELRSIVRVESEGDSGVGYHVPVLEEEGGV